MVRRSDSSLRLAVDRALSRLHRSGEAGPVFAGWFGGVEPRPPLKAMYLLHALPE